MMNTVNNLQVQSTNDASTISKYSAVCRNYFKDDFIQYFVEKKKSRASLIHLGYYVRAVILYQLVTRFIKTLNLENLSKFQIISCGAGFDTTYWRLMEDRLLNKESILIEIDFPSVIKKKISLIKKSEKLKSFTSESNSIYELPSIHQLNHNFFLMEADLCDICTIEKIFSCIKVDYNIPTLFISECVITYMKETESSKLIQWMSKQFSNSYFINYEQIHPEDGFGKVMLRHFEKLQSSLFSVSKYPNCESHYLRYKNLGFKCAFALPEWDALVKLTSEHERKMVFNLELFDEFEEFHLKCTHYVVGLAGNDNLMSWMNQFGAFRFYKNGQKCIELNKIKSDLELYRHSSCSFKGNIFLFGGCNRQSRSSKIFKIIYKDLCNPEVKNIECTSTGDCNVQLDFVYGTAVCFYLDGVSYVCIYGGRSSPDKVCNNGCAIVYNLDNDTMSPVLVIEEGNPIPRYRSTMKCLNSTANVVQCWIFGGKTVNTSLSDFWELTFSRENNHKLNYRWKLHERKTENWPCERASHSLSVCNKRFSLFLSCGLKTDSMVVLDDIWKWCCTSEAWEKLKLNGKLLPRYGHTSHVINDMLYLVGGVNTTAGSQPGLAKIDLNELTVTEYSIQYFDVDPVLLFNHTSEVIDDGEDDPQIWILGGGGNCFSFGTYLNRGIHSIKLNQFLTQ